MTIGLKPTINQPTISLNIVLSIRILLDVLIHNQNKKGQLINKLLAKSKIENNLPKVNFTQFPEKKYLFAGVDFHLLKWRVNMHAYKI